MLLTETEWSTCRDPEPMLHAICFDKLQREARVFAITCVRRVWHLLPDGCRHAVDISELFANGHVDLTRLITALSIAEKEARAICIGGRSPDARAYAASAAVDASSVWERTPANVLSSTSCAASAIACAAAEKDESNYDQIFEDARVVEIAAQAEILRTVVSLREFNQSRTKR